jgi:SAM-dependent methyltransferase
VTGVDASEDAVAAARTLVQRLDLADRAQIVHARCEATGLPETSFDTIFMRNVLIHNGPNVDSILAHARALLKPGGHLLAMEIDATATEMPPTASDEYEMEMRWVDWASSVGNDPAFGRVLAKTVERAGFTIRDTQSRVDQLSVERSPVWTARGALLEGGFATELDIDRWGRAIAGRLSTVGLLDARLHVYVVVGQRP